MVGNPSVSFGPCSGQSWTQSSMAGQSCISALSVTPSLTLYEEVPDSVLMIFIIRVFGAMRTM